MSRPHPTPPARPATTGSAPASWVLPVLTLLGTLLAISAAALGSGAFGGTPVNEAAGGALSADATPLAPAGPAFRIWSVIYLGLIGYALWQLSGPARRSPRQAALRPWALAAIVLNALWIWTVQLGSLTVSVAVIAVLLAVLIRIMFLLGAARTGGRVEWLLSDVTFGLYFGWVLAASFANTWAWLADAGLNAFRETPVAVVGLVVAAAVAISAAWFSGGRVPPALATGWGLAWIAVGRAEGQFASEPLVWVAGLAAILVLLSPLPGLIRRRP